VEYPKEYYLFIETNLFVFLLTIFGFFTSGFGFGIIFPTPSTPFANGSNAKNH
jgi:hypothetical protein